VDGRLRIVLRSRIDHIVGPEHENNIHLRHLGIDLVHFDEVIDPDGLLTVLASSSACPIHAFRFGARPVWGVQAHPEIGPEDGRELLAAELARGYPGADLIGRALRSEPRDSGLIRAIVASFLGA